MKSEPTAQDWEIACLELVYASRHVKMHAAIKTRVKELAESRVKTVSIAGKITADFMGRIREEFSSADHIQDIRRVSLEPGDKLVLRFKERLNPEHTSRIKENLAKAFPDVPVILLDNGATLEAVSTADGASREAESKARDENSVGVGMAIAAAILMRVWGDDVQAKEIIGAAGLTTEKKLLDIGVEEYDLCELRPLLDEAEQPA